MTPAVIEPGFGIARKGEVPARHRKPAGKCLLGEDRFADIAGIFALFFRFGE